MSITLPTAAQVRALISTSKTDLEIDDVVAYAGEFASNCSSVLAMSTTMQAQIVAYLTAHFLSIQAGTGGVIQSEALGDASRSYAIAPQRTGGNALAATRYGQQAMLLDVSGCLEGLGKRKARVKVI